MQSDQSVFGIEFAGEKGLVEEEFGGVGVAAAEWRKRGGGVSCC